MPKRSLLGTLVAICVVAACGDSPTGIEPFEPQFEVFVDNPVTAPNTFRYTFDDFLPGDPFCTPGDGSDETYEDLTFVGWDDVGGCFANALLMFGGGAFSIQHAAASEVSLTVLNEIVTLTAFDDFGECTDAVVGSGPTLTIACAGITSIGISGTFFTIFDDLTITYEAGVTATAGLSPVADKSLKHNKGRFEVQATCSDAPVTTATATLNAVTVVDGQEVDLRLRSKKKSVKPAKSRKPLRITDSDFTLTVTCGTDIDTAEPVFADKSAKSEKSEKSDKSKKSNKSDKSNKG